MEDLLKACCSDKLKNSICLQKGVYLVEHYNKNFIIKEKPGGFIGKLRHRNEYFFYRNGRSAFKHFSIPELIGTCPDKRFIINYVKGEKFIQVPADILIPGYIEFQNIKERSASFFNYIFRLSGGFFYRICLVSIFTLSRKINVLITFKVLQLYYLLNLRQKKFNKSFRIHGDLRWSNMIKSTENELVLIDFENTYTTKKWPLSELMGFSFSFIDRNLKFSEAYLLSYLRHLDPGTQDQIMRNCLKRQIRFGILQYSIAQIAQTKGERKKKAYHNLLETVLDRQEFENWYAKHISAKF